MRDLLLSSFNCPTAPAGTALTCLRTLPIDEMRRRLFDTLASNSGFLLQPVVGDEFLTEEPRRLLESGRFNREVTLLAGWNSDEGNLLPIFLPDTPFPLVDGEYQRQIERLLAFFLHFDESAPVQKRTLAQRRLIAETVELFYAGERTGFLPSNYDAALDADSVRNYRRAMDMVGDIIVRVRDIWI